MSAAKPTRPHFSSLPKGPLQRCSSEAVLPSVQYMGQIAKCTVDQLTHEPLSWNVTIGRSRKCSSHTECDALQQSLLDLHILCRSLLAASHVVLVPIRDSRFWIQQRLTLDWTPILWSEEHARCQTIVAQHQRLQGSKANTL